MQSSKKLPNDLHPIDITQIQALFEQTKDALLLANPSLADELKNKINLIQTMLDDEIGCLIIKQMMDRAAALALPPVLPQFDNPNDDQTTGVMQKFPRGTFYYEEIVNGEPVVKNFNSSQHDIFENDRICIHIPKDIMHSVRCYIQIKKQNKLYIPLNAYWESAEADNDITDALQLCQPRGELTPDQFFALVANNPRVLVLSVGFYSSDMILHVLKKASSQFLSYFRKEYYYFDRYSQRPYIHHYPEYKIVKNLLSECEPDPKYAKRDDHPLIDYFVFENQDVTLYIAKSRHTFKWEPLVQVESHAIKKGSNMPIPLDEFFKDPAINVADIFKTAKEFQTQRTLFNLDDSMLAKIVGSNQRVLTYFLNEAPKHQLMRVKDMLDKEHRPTNHQDKRFFKKDVHPLLDYTLFETKDHVRLYIAKPGRSVESHVIKRGATEPVPLDVFIKDPETDIATILKTAKEFQTQQTLFDLDDNTLAEMLGSNPVILSHVVNDARMYQLKRMIDVISARQKMPDRFDLLNQLSQFASPKRSEQLVQLTSELRPGV